MLEDPVRWRKLVAEYGALRRLKATTPQARGQRFNGLIAELLSCFGIAAQPNQRGVGEMDVTFSLGGSRFILEAKWERHKTATGPVAKLQRRVEQRMAGVTGVLLSMKGFTPEAIADTVKGRRLDVLLLDGLHWEAMLSGFVPPEELFRLAADQASFHGRAYTPLAELLEPAEPPPNVVFATPNEFSGGLVRSGAADVRAEVVLAGFDSRQVGIAERRAGIVLLTADHGIVEIDTLRQTLRWAVPVRGCCHSPLPQPDGSVLIARAHGIAHYRGGTLTIVSSGGTAYNNGYLLAHPDGSVWCFDNGTRLGRKTAQPTLIRLGSHIGEEQWITVPLPAATAASAAWLSTTHAVVTGSRGFLHLTTSTGEARAIPTPYPNPAGLLRVDDHRVMAAGGDLTVFSIDTLSGQHVKLADVQVLHGSACQLAAATGGAAYVAAYYQSESGQSLCGVLRLRLPNEWAPRSEPPVTRALVAETAQLVGQPSESTKDSARRSEASDLENLTAADYWRRLNNRESDPLAEVWDEIRNFQRQVQLHPEQFGARKADPSKIRSRWIITVKRGTTEVVRH